MKLCPACTDRICSLFLLDVLNVGKVSVLFQEQEVDSCQHVLYRFQPLGCDDQVLLFVRVIVEVAVGALGDRTGNLIWERYW